MILLMQTAALIQDLFFLKKSCDLDFKDQKKAIQLYCLLALLFSQE